MTFLVTSKSSPVLANASQKEEVPDAVMSVNNASNCPDNSLLRHYSLLSSSFLIEEDSLIESLPSLYFNEDDKKEDTEEDDTEEDDDDYTTAKDQKTPPADFTNMTSCLIKKAAPAAALLSPASSSSSQSITLPPIQTYSPQLNLSLYSPSPSVASSIRSTRKSCSSSSNSHHSYSLASSAAPLPSTIKSSCTSASAAFVFSAAARNPTLTSSNNIKRQTPLYSTATISSSSKTTSTIKMDIRSPPQPSQSTSRFMNAFHRFRNSAASSANNISQKNASYHHHQNTTNSVAPAEVVSTMKPSPSKSSLADKIKSKFHQQLDKKKNRVSLVELSTKKKALSNFSMPRSASLSSMTNWSSRLGSGNSNKSTPLKKGINVHNDKLKLSHSASVSSRLSMSSSLSSSSSCCSSSSSSHSLNHPPCRSTGGASLFVSPQIATSSPATSPPAFSLTKSISSHRLYNKSSSEVSSTNSDAGSTSRHSHQAITRPRQPLRAVNPNDSVRFVMRQSSPMSASSNSRKSSLQQQQHQKTIVRFSKLVSVRETYSKTDYDRGSDPDAVCTRLTPAMAQQIKEELNAYKLHEMQVHEYSRVHTHFFI
ncbi:hypothetical protein MAM1_0206d07988 [Mucor ambiguus]|uniref:Bud neck involved protein n=2 Tax=Mucor TaxID=4830 RepID=A0A0C9MCV9_9FUNG|nr:hypothetical protein MAM1_0206d07988 [Mucor ambiguus]